MTSRHNVHSRGNIGQRSDLVTWVGGSCGRHGSYVFYKAFRFHLLPIFGPSTTPVSGLRNRSRERRSGAAKTEEYPSDEAEREGRVRTNQERILSLGEFFFVQCRPEDPVCVGEIQLLWHDKHSGQDLSSTRLYYLPETTPAGRASQHGEDEVLAVSEKIVMRTADLASWIVEPDEWHYGSALLAPPTPKNGGSQHFANAPLHRYSALRPSVNMNDVNMEKRALHTSKNRCVHERDPKAVADEANKWKEKTQRTTPSKTCFCVSQRKAEVVVLNMNSYCRHKAMMKRMEGMDKTWLALPSCQSALAALGVFANDNTKARVVFCRDTFDYPQLLEHDLICEELAPVFKGRPRKKLKKVTLPGSKVAQKKSGNACGRVRCVESPVDFAKHDADPSTRRSSGRRRSKRRSPQTLLYEEQYAPLLARKRGRRVATRTPTPVCDLPREKSDLGTSNPNSPGSDAGPAANEGKGVPPSVSAAQTAKSAAARSPQSDYAANKRKGRARKRAAGRPCPPSALNIAIQNSLLESNKPAGGYRSSKGRKVSKPNRSASSSRSSSPAAEVLSNKAPSPTGSSASSAASNDAYASSHSPSTSPAEFGFLPSSFESRSTSTNESSLRGLMDGVMPESEAVFLKNLYDFMSNRNTPIGRIPSLGFKKLDLWDFFKLSQEYGGYDMVTAKRLWKHVYDRMGGNPSCTSAATCTRKHFEKLLLPFEMHLRQQLRNKETTQSETKQNGTDNFVNGNTAPDNSLETKPIQRAFNGDAYFYNGAKEKIAPVKLETRTTVHAPKLKQSFPEDANKPRSTEDKAANCPSKTHAKLTTTQPSPLVNFEAHAFNVIRDELLTSREPVRKRSVSPEDLSTKCSDAKREAKTPVCNFDIVRLPSSEVTSSTLFTSSAAPSYSRASVIVGATRGSQSRAGHCNAPTTRPALIPTRNYCPRMSAPPPPFVPTKPKPSSFVAQQGPARLRGVTSATVMTEAERSRLSSSASPNSHLRHVERADDHARHVQKRLCDDGKMHRFPSASQSSPKRSRCEEIIPGAASPASSHRKYDIRNLVSIPTAHTTVSATLTRDRSSLSGRQVFHAKAEGHSLQPTRPPVESLHPPNFVDPRRLGEAQRPVIVSAEGRSRPTVLTNDLSTASNSKYLTARSDGDRNARLPSPGKRSEPMKDAQPRRETYYRPTGMLATHREAAKHHQQQQQQQLWQQKGDASLSVHSTDVARRSESSLIAKSISPAAEVARHSRDALDKQASASALPKREFEPQSHMHRRSLPSAFSVERLTSNAPTPQPSCLSRASPSEVAGKNARYAVHSHVKQDRQLPPIVPSNLASKESYRLARAPVVDTRSEYHQFLHKSDQDKLQQTAATTITTASIPSKERVPAHALSRTFPSPESIAMLRPVPKNCSPEIFDRIFQDKLLPTVVSRATMHPQQIAALREATLRQQLEPPAHAPFRPITHQEQQAAAACQMATLTNCIAAQDLGWPQLYQSHYLRQMQEAGASTAAMPSGKLGPAGSADILQDMVRMGMNQFPIATSTLPGARAPAAFVAVPPHLSDLTAAFTHMRP